MAEKIRVAISGLMYPVTMMRYFHDALERRDDLEVISVGPFFGSWIPWQGGMNLPERYVKMPTVALPQTMANHHIKYEMVKNLIPGGEIDIWLQADAGWHFSTRPRAKVVALIETDPHVLKRQYDVPKAYSDITFCMQTPYMEDGEIWLPYACDTTKFYPDPSVEITNDACLVGLPYSQRDLLVGRVRASGATVIYGIGAVYDEYRQLYNSAKIALSWSSLEDTPVRVFEAMGMKRPLVANRTPDILRLFREEEHFLGFSTVDEAVHQVNRLLQIPDLATKIADAGYQEVIDKHTWDHRIDQILNACGY